MICLFSDEERDPRKKGKEADNLECYLMQYLE
jgi:hypothetical protein